MHIVHPKVSTNTGKYKDYLTIWVQRFNKLQNTLHEYLHVFSLTLPCFIRSLVGLDRNLI